MHRPLLFISTPTDEGSHIKHQPISISSEQPSIQNRLLSSQLRYFLRQPKRMRSLHFKLKSGSEYIGELKQMDDPVVTIIVNDIPVEIDGNEIDQIKRIY
jgi:hypothetical protein